MLFRITEDATAGAAALLASCGCGLRVDCSPSALRCSGFSSTKFIIAPASFHERKLCSRSARITDTCGTPSRAAWASKRVGGGGGGSVR
tara:strand:- start:348 stop:614 length:267 start_codon:yes stop_codon:yes gene_type:complete